MGSQVWSLLSLGVGLNIVLGALVAAFKLPIYLDSVGTILVAALAGPWAALLAGGCGVALLGLTSPTAFAFLPVGMAVGLMGGLAARLGAFRKSWSAALAGAVVGCASAALAAPISAYMFGGVTGGGTDLLVALFRSSGMNAWQASFAQSLTVDTADKVVTFLLIHGLLRALPRRAASAFPLAEKLPPPESREGDSLGFAPQLASSSESESFVETERSGGSPEKSALYPEAPTTWKVAALCSVLAAAGFSSLPLELTLALLALFSVYLLAAPALAWMTARRLFLGLLPLALSLVLIQGLVAHLPGEAQVQCLGLLWSVPGLRTAWLFMARVATMVFALTMFIATTPLQRLAELLLRIRIPYPIVFVLLTGANLANRLRDRWRIVAEAQEARGLDLRRKGFGARLELVRCLLTPTLGAVFSEIPQRAANLESRGFLHARPKWPVPLAWTGERQPTLGGRLFYASITLASWAFVAWG